MHVWQGTPNHYNTATQGRYFHTVHADATVTADEGSQGAGDAAWTGSSEDAYRIFQVRHGSGHSFFSLKIDYRIAAYPAAHKAILGVTDASGNLQCSIVQKTDGTLSIYRGGTAGTEIATSAVTVDLDTYYNLGFTGLIHQSTGYAEIWLGEDGDSSTWAVYRRIDTEDTQNEDTSDWSGVYIGSTDETASCHGHARNGDGVDTAIVPGWLVNTSFMAATGGLTAWVSNVATRHEAVDETPPDDDTSYVASTALGDAVSFEPDALGSANGILAIDVVATVQNETGVTRSYEPLIIVNADDATLRTEVPATWRSLSDSSWRGIHEPYGVNPHTGIAWASTDATVQGRIEVGGRVAA